MYAQPNCVAAAVGSTGATGWAAGGTSRIMIGPIAGQRRLGSACKIRGLTVVAANLWPIGTGHIGRGPMTHGLALHLPANSAY